MEESRSSVLTRRFTFTGDEIEQLIIDRVHQYTLQEGAITIKWDTGEGGYVRSVTLSLVSTHKE